MAEDVILAIAPGTGIFFEGDYKLVVEGRIATYGHDSQEPERSTNTATAGAREGLTVLRGVGAAKDAWQGIEIWSGSTVGIMNIAANRFLSGNIFYRTKIEQADIPIHTWSDVYVLRSLITGNKYGIRKPTNYDSQLLLAQSEIYAITDPAYLYGNATGQRAVGIFGSYFRGGGLSFGSNMTAYTFNNVFASVWVDFPYVYTNYAYSLNYKKTGTSTVQR